PASASAVVLLGEGLSFPVAIPALGDALELVGHLDPAPDAPFAMDPAYEYTWTVYGPVVHAVENVAPGLSTRSLTFGTMEIRADPAANASFVPYPPNSLVPSAFHDGAVALMGVLTGLRIQEVFGIVTAVGTVEFESGASLAQLDPVRVWTFRAAVSPFDPSIPAGFGARWSLQLDPAAPVGIRAATWGGIKALYR
ncbi:MAG TPA: hypothetical protein VKU85_19505, partial [bacterium]|nr:hypothetical protein [bacterium]